MVEFIQEKARHYCRNPKCRSKLPAPVATERDAFCTRGCHRAFYRHRCLICEKPMERKTERQLTCGKRACRKALQAGESLGRYRASSGVISPSKKPVNKGPKEAVKDDRARSWYVVAAGTPISANAYHCATVGAGEASDEADRINGKHWRSAKAGERGYRQPDAPDRQPEPELRLAA
jgi:hypothetical protein